MPAGQKTDTREELLQLATRLEKGAAHKRSRRDSHAESESTFLKTNTKPRGYGGYRRRGTFQRYYPPRFEDRDGPKIG